MWLLHGLNIKKCPCAPITQLKNGNNLTTGPKPSGWPLRAINLSYNLRAVNVYNKWSSTYFLLTVIRPHYTGGARHAIRIPIKHTENSNTVLA